MSTKKSVDIPEDLVRPSTASDNAPSGDPVQYDAPLPATPGDLAALDGILQLFLKSAHIDFSHYRQPTIVRRIARRMSLCSKNSYAEYLGFLENTPHEVEQLYDDLLLSYTEFFRDGAVFDELKKTVFPRLMDNRSTKTPLRFWIAGCSTGEEVYSLAITFHEYLAETKTNATAQFFGTDLNQRHITTARRGVYPDKIRKAVSAERLARYFDQTSDGLQVTKQIREMCVFAVQDVTQDPPFPSIDLVSCRNVLIYFDAAFQDIVIPLFHFSLKPNGYLLLGSSESMGKFTELFSVVNSTVNLYSKRFTPHKSTYRFPGSAVSLKFRAGNGIPSPLAPRQPAGACMDISKQIDTILLDAYAPPCLVVDCTMHIRQFRGDTAAYLAPATGEASLKLSKMTSGGLMPDIYVAIEEAKKKNAKITKKNITFKQNNALTTIDLGVVPIPDSSTGETCFLITFETPQNAGQSAHDLPDGADNPNDELRRLSHDLQTTKEHLQSIIDEKDEVNQDLWSANEEIQSTNEELQSVNEEMEAAKEELESSNEELIALNEEMQAKNLELKESEDKFKHLVWDMQVGVLLQGPATEILLCNPQALELLGLSENQLLGKTSFDPDWNVIHEDGSAFPGPDHPVSQAIATRMPVRNVVMGVYRPITKNRVWLLVDAEPQLQADGTVRQVACSFINITERKIAENALRDSELRYRTLFSTMLEGFALHEIICDSAGKPVDYRFLDMNPAFERLTGLKKNEIIGNTVLTLMPETEPFWIEKYGAVALSGEPTNFENYSAALNRYYDVVAFSPSKNQFAVIFSDITERKQAELALLKNSELLSLFVKHSPVYCYIKEVNSSRSTVLYASDNFRQMIGIPGSEMVGKTMFELYPPEFAAKITADDWAVVSRGEIFRQDEDLNGRNYTTIKFPIAQNDKTLLAGYTIDITERKQTEAKLNNVQKLESLGVLAGGIAHDFNNLMGGIFGYIDLAITEPDKGKTSSLLAKAMTTIDRARGLTAQLLTFAKGGDPIQKVTPLFPFIEESARFALSGSNVSCRFDISENLWPCNIDKSQIGQVVDNIIINAQQAMTDGGTITLTAQNISLGEQEHLSLRKGNYVKVSIKDSGVGIAKEIMPRIFDPFYTTKPKGHGLGLATCYSIINRHGGCIDVESSVTAPGSGSTFHFYLPADSTPVISENRPMHVNHSGHGTIIVMDDEEVIRDTFTAMLTTLGYTVECKSNGRETLDFFTQEIKAGRIITAIILDLTIPGGMGGKATVAEIKKLNASAGIPVFVASGYADDPVMKNPTEYGFTASICKPFKRSELNEMLDKHIKTDL